MLSSKIKKTYRILDETDRPVTTGPKGNAKYDFEDMGYGDSWLYYQINPQSLMKAVRNTEKRLGIAFTIKKISPVACIVSRPPSNAQLMSQYP